MQLNDIKKIESRVLELEEKSSTLLSENVKDLKEIKNVKEETDGYLNSLINEMKIRLFNSMPPFKSKDKNERVELIREYYKILANYEGVNKFVNINACIYYLINPLDINNFNQNIQRIIEILNSYSLKISKDDFDLNEVAFNYMSMFFDNMENKDFYEIMKDEFDKSYWQNHSLLEDIVLGVRLFLYRNVDAIIGKLKQIKDKYLVDNKLDASKIESERENLEKEEFMYNFSDIKSLLNKIQNNEIDTSLADVSSKDYLDNVNVFVSNEYYEQTDKDDFIENIFDLRNNLYEYKMYEQFEFIIGIIAEIEKKKEEYKNVYKTKKTSINNLLNKINKNKKEFEKKKKNKEKIVAKKCTLLFNEKSKEKALDKANKSVLEIYTKLQNDCDLLKTEFEDYDIALFREKVSQKVNSNYSIYEDLSLFKNNVIILKKYIKENNNELTEEEIEKKYEEFNEFLAFPFIETINTFTFEKSEKVDEVLMNKFKLININFELSKENVDELINACNNILNGWYLNKSGLEFLSLKMIEKYLIIKKKSTE